MKSKLQRWYEAIDGTAYIYDTPYPQTATSVNVVPVSELAARNAVTKAKRAGSTGEKA